MRIETGKFILFLGNISHPMQMAASTSGMTAVGNTTDMSQVVVGQRTYAEHQSVSLKYFIIYAV